MLIEVTAGIGRMINCSEQFSMTVMNKDLPQFPNQCWSEGWTLGFGVGLCMKLRS